MKLCLVKIQVKNTVKRNRRSNSKKKEKEKWKTANLRLDASWLLLVAVKGNKEVAHCIL